MKSNVIEFPSNSASRPRPFKPDETFKVFEVKTVGSQTRLFTETGLMVYLDQVGKFPNKGLEVKSFPLGSLQSSAIIVHHWKDQDGETWEELSYDTLKSYCKSWGYCV